MAYNISKLGKRLKNLRETANLTQQQVADYLEAEQSFITKLENGEVSINSDALERLSYLFCCPVSSIISDEDATPAFNVRFSKEHSREDLQAISDVNRIVLNQSEIDQLIERD